MVGDEADPAASLSPDYTLLDRLAEEFVERFRRGERPALAEYTDRHPEMADQIKELFPALVQMELVEGSQGCLAGTGADEGVGLPPGTRIGDFEVISVLGRGGMGVVYEAEQVSLGRRVALKILPGGVATDHTTMERFRREARSAARLHHTNIVPVFETGAEGDVLYYAMQLIRGQGLDSVLHEVRRLRGPANLGRPATSSSGAEPPSTTFARSGGGSGTADTPGHPPTGSIAQRLLSGQFAPQIEGAGIEAELPPPGLASTCTAILTPRPGATDRRTGESAEGPVRSREEAPGAPNRASVPRVPGKSSASASPHGDAQISTLAPSDRGYFRGVADIGRQVANALAYAHARGIVHRDIKPSNLLLDAEGVAWISDFGLAKGEEDDLTRTGDILGTLRYMAPERFQGKGDGRADIYSLGLTLYELLTLRPAFDSSDRLRLVERIKADEPARPRSLDPRIPRDLDTIVTKAIDKDPRRRYPTSDAMAEDLRRFVDGEPILARRISETERVWKWIRRRPALAASLASLACSLVVGTIVSVFFAIRATANAERASERAAAAILARQESQSAQGRAERAERESSLQSANLLLDRGLALAEEGKAGAGLLWMLAALRTAPDDATDLRQAVLTNISAWSRRLVRVRWIAPPAAAIEDLRLCPDGRQLAIKDGKGQVRILDSETGRQIAGPWKPAPLGGSAKAPMAFTPDGKMLILTRGNLLERLDARTLDPVGEPMGASDPPTTAPWLLAVRPDSRLLLAMSAVQPARYFDPGSGARLDSRGQLTLANGAHFLPDGRLFTVRILPVGGTQIELRDRDGRERVAGPWVHRSPRHDEHSWWFTPNPDGRSYWSFSRPGVLQQYGMIDGQKIGPELKGPELRRICDAPAMSLPDGRGFLFTAGQQTLTFLPTLPIGVGAGLSTIGPDARWFVTRYGSSAIRAEFGDDWPLVLEQDRPETSFVSSFLSATYSPDRETVILGAIVHEGDQLVVALRETAVDRPRGPGVRFKHDAYSIRCPIAISPDGRLAAAASGMTIRVIDTQSGLTVGRPMRHINSVSSLAFSPDGSTLAAGDYSHAVILWDLATQRPARPPLIQPYIVLSVDFRPDGKALAVGTASDQSHPAVLKLWDLGSGKPIGQEVVHPGWVGVKFSPDGSALITTCGQSVRFLDARTGEPIGVPTEFPGELFTIQRVAFLPDGRRALVGSNTGQIRLFDAANGRVIPGTVLSHPDEAEVTALCVAPDGRLALVGYADGTARLCDLAVARPIGPLMRIGLRVIGAAFSPDGRTAMATSSRGATHRWPVPVPVQADEDRLALRLESETGLRLEPGPTVTTLDPADWLGRRDALRSLGEDPDAPLSARPDGAAWHAYRAHEAEEAGAIDTAVWHLERLARLCPDNGTVAARIGGCHADAGRFDLAAEAYDRAEARGGLDQFLDQYRSHVVVCLAARRYATARWYLDRILSRKPDDAQLLADRAIVRSELGDVPGAEADLVHAAASARDPELLVALGSKLARAGRWTESGSCFSRAAAIGPLIYSDQGRAAVALLRAGDGPAFRGFVKQLLADLDSLPSSPLGVVLHAWPALLGPITPEQAGRLAMIFEGVADRVRPRGDVPASLKHAFFLAAGAALYRAGRHAEAIARLGEGIAAGGGDVEPQDDAFLAMSHHALGHRDEALRHLDRLAQVDPMGDFWEDLERRQLRLEAEAVVRLDPAFPDDPFAREGHLP